jgi:CRP/FNR family transcriptional regulator
MAAGADQARVRELLRATPYFARLDEAALARLARATQTRHYSAGQRIFAEGDDEGAAALHIVDRGVVRIFKLSAEGREQVLRLMRPGDSFADVPAFDGGPYPAHADALEPASVVVLPRKELLEVLRAYPEMAIGALQILAARLRHMTGLVEDLSLRRVMSRVAKLLYTYEGELHLTQGQMAAMVGTAREMVNRSLHTLADAGAIELRGQQIVVLDRAKLARAAEAG